MKKRKIFTSEYGKKGFSLVEMVIILSILVIIISLASTSFKNLAPKYRLKKAVWEIYSRMNYARYKAIFEGIKVRIKFYSGSFAIETYDESQKKWKREAAYSIQGVSLQANNSPIFHPQGSVSNLASIIISNSWGKYKITLAISGRVKTLKL